MPIDKQIKLTKITYKAYDKKKTNRSLKAIQLHFTGGRSTELFEGTKNDGMMSSCYKESKDVNV